MKDRRISGFTLLELLIVIAIIAILVTVIIAALGSSRARAQDADIKQVLADARNLAQEAMIEEGTFINTFGTGGKVYEAISGLADKYMPDGNHTYYEFKASDSNFVIVFPLKSITGYWCVDAEAKAVQTIGLPNAGGTENCENTLRDPIASQGSPILTLLGSTSQTVDPLTFPEPSYTAFGPQGNDLTSAVTSLTFKQSFTLTSPPDGTCIKTRYYHMYDPISGQQTQKQRNFTWTTQAPLCTSAVY